MNSHHRKTRQLCAAIERTLQSSLACDVEDPVLDDVTLDHVEPVDGAFVAVFMTSTLSLRALGELQAHLDASLPIFKEAMARDLARKRVPTVTCVVVPYVKGLDDAASEHGEHGEHRSLGAGSDL